MTRSWAFALFSSIWACLVSPSRAGHCAGVWTRTWKHKEGKLPESVMAAVNATGHAKVLLEVLEKHQCPYGIALPGQVTWPQPPEKLESVSAHMDWLKALAVIYSYLPYIVAFHFAVNFALRRGTRQLAVVGFLVCMVGLNELFVKHVFHADRPGTMLQVKDANGRLAGSCSETCGMPSSHSMLATGLLLLLSLDISFRVESQVWYAKSMLQEILLPIADEDTLTPREFLYVWLFWWTVLAPVPLSRIILFDHTPQQAVIGCAHGVVYATCWWRMLRFLERRHDGAVNQRMLSGLVIHNYWHPSIARPSRVLSSHLTNSSSLDEELSAVMLQPCDSSANRA
mmetsp:Transcript_45530/g.105532  ORF Transcript_45530/g.105532 Transcript_45530/m.105532 type:complete len:341 (+) Transcript_45530:137-1159(+)